MSVVHGVVLGDVHLPWAHKPSIKAAVEIIAQTQPTYVVQVGDLQDQFFASRYAKRYGKMSPEQEYELATSEGAAFWSQITSASKKSKRYQLRGNHDERIYKKLIDRAPELAGIVDVPADFMQFDGVTTVDSSREELHLRMGKFKVVLVHGWLSKLGDHAKYFNSNVICGHSHRPGIVYHKQHDKLIWEANAGYLGDDKAPCFKYGENSRKNWGRGVLLIEDKGPRFVSFE